MVLSDGQDNGSVSHSLDDVVARALEKGVPVFTTGFGDVHLPILQYLADESGGQYFQAPSSGELEAVYDRISAILSNQYIIEYTTLSSSGENVTLDVEVGRSNGDQVERE